MHFALKNQKQCNQYNMKRQHDIDLNSFSPAHKMALFSRKMTTQFLFAAVRFVYVQAAIFKPGGTHSSLQTAFANALQLATVAFFVARGAVPSGRVRRITSTAVFIAVPTLQRAYRNADFMRDLPQHCARWRQQPGYHSVFECLSVSIH
jgi:hypothetical protein